MLLVKSRNAIIVEWKFMETIMDFLFFLLSAIRFSCTLVSDPDPAS